jgi:mRNA-degrading endonuclease YafQ of YafQ-DinJ toxin-antitoxin module
MSRADEPPPRVVITAKAFERDVKRLGKRGVDREPLWVVVEAVRLGHPLESRHRDHALTGEWK